MHSQEDTERRTIKNSYVNNATQSYEIQIQIQNYVRIPKQYKKKIIFKNKM